VNYTAVRSVNIHATQMAHEKRPYRKSKRAELEEQTRLRLTESAVELHSTLGPSRTSMSAVAEHAGVRRSTLYRHFADEAELFAACTAHWAQANPLPELESWAAIRDPDERLRVALGELYGFYERNESLMANILRDENTVPGVKEQFAPFREYLGAAVGALMARRGLRGRARRDVAAAVGHALAFRTWESLVREQNLAVERAIELMCELVAVAADR
jgi:AcrR family transcriptional regulator